MFGYSIPLNFNKKGDQHTTVYGGIVSIFLKIVISLYVLQNVLKMFNYGDDATSSAMRKIDLDVEGPLDQTQKDGLFLFWVLKNTEGGNKALNLDGL